MLTQFVDVHSYSLTWGLYYNYLLLETSRAKYTVKFDMPTSPTNALTRAAAKLSFSKTRRAHYRIRPAGFSHPRARSAPNKKYVTRKKGPCPVGQNRIILLIYSSSISVVDF